MGGNSLRLRRHESLHLLPQGRRLRLSLAASAVRQYPNHRDGGHDGYESPNEEHYNYRRRHKAYFTANFAGRKHISTKKRKYKPGSNPSIRGRRGVYGRNVS